MNEERKFFYDNVVTSCEITCSICLKTEVDTNTDEYAFVENLIGNGWKVMTDEDDVSEILCPKCLKDIKSKWSKK